MENGRDRIGRAAGEMKSIVDIPFKKESDEAGEEKGEPDAKGKGKQRTERKTEGADTHFGGNESGHSFNDWRAQRKRAEGEERPDDKGAEINQPRDPRAEQRPMIPDRAKGSERANLERKETEPSTIPAAA